MTCFPDVTPTVRPAAITAPFRGYRRFDETTRIWGSGLLLVGGLLCAACIGEDGEAGPGVEIRDSAGVKVVRSSERGRLGEGLLPLRELRRIGGREGEQPYLFFEISDIAIDDNGSYFVGNNGSGTVRVFDSQGAFVREFGGKGEGPSEVTMINRVWLEGDSVILVDWQRGGKTVVFTKQGRFVDSWSFVRRRSASAQPVAHLPQGWVAGFSSSGQGDGPYARGERVERPWDLYLSFPKRDSLGDLLFQLPPQIRYGVGQGAETVGAPFQGASSYGFDAAGSLYISAGFSYQIDVYDHTGNLTRRIARDFAPIPVTSEDLERVREAELARADSMLARWQVSPETIERQRRFNALMHQARFGLPLPPHLPPLGRLLVAADGAFWIQRMEDTTPVEFVLKPPVVRGLSRSAPNRSTYWDIFDPAGVFLGTAELPARFNPLAVTERTVTGVLMDDLDVEFVVTFEVAAGD